MDTVVAGIIEGEAGELLMVRGPAETWTFPSGLRRADESHEGAMRRVALETLGVELEIHTGQPPLQGEYEGRSALYRFFLAHAFEGEPSPIGYSEVRWIGISEARQLKLEPLIRQVLEWYVEDAR